jgi:hypothetical protein
MLSDVTANAVKVCHRGASAYRVVDDSLRRNGKKVKSLLARFCAMQEENGAFSGKARQATPEWVRTAKPRRLL